jgi:hypothetical protein
MQSPEKVVRDQQQEWAQNCGIAVHSTGYTTSLNDNLFIPLSPETNAEFSDADGSELGKPGERSKMQALHSSSALACNVFEYWRGRNAWPIAKALRIDEGIESIAFERKFRTGLRGKAPNLDVVLLTHTGRVIAIECKFLEPYGSHNTRFKPKYFETEPGLWQSAGFPNCQALAQRLYSGGHQYRWLNAEQLLKHILGLQKGPHKHWALLYLWYRVPGTEGREHAAEAESFASFAVGDGIDFRAMSYQTLYRELEARAPESDAKYLAYLGERYFKKSD